MSKFRPELGDCDGSETFIPNDTALFLIRDSVAKRRSLIHGMLEDGKGHYCALGAFWQDYPGTSINVSIVDEVAAVNDSVPITATPRERWKKVNEWLRFKISAMTTRQAKA